MKDNKLEVGDELYYINSGQVVYAGKVNRVTKTLAFTKRFAYYIDMEHGYTTRRGAERLCHDMYYLLDADKKAEIVKQRARYSLERPLTDIFGPSSYEAVKRLTDSQLSRIIGILEEEGKP